MSRTRVEPWTPGFLAALRLAWKPVLAYTVFSTVAFVVFVLTIVSDPTPPSDLRLIVAVSAAGLVGILVGQALALLRLKTIPTAAVVTVFVAGSFAVLGRDRGDNPAAVCVAFFSLAMPCGLLALQHRYELVAAFWPTVGWIGAVLAILERHGGLVDWKADKVTVWTPTTVGILASYAVTLLIYLAAKQTMRVELWQALSGSTERRVTKRRTTLAAVPRRNVWPLVALGLLLAGVVAVLAPYVWRTGPANPGEHEGGDSSGPDGSAGPDIDGEALARAVQQMEHAALAAVRHLWPALLLFVLYRPFKRVLLLRHLRRPLVPTPPSERVDNLWEYVRIAAEDTGVASVPADSVDDFVTRVKAAHPRAAAALDRAAAIYSATRYGFVIERGAAAAMQEAAADVTRDLRSRMTRGEKIRAAWRPLS